MSSQLRIDALMVGILPECAMLLCVISYYVLRSKSERIETKAVNVQV